MTDSQFSLFTYVTLYAIAGLLLFLWELSSMKREITTWRLFGIILPLNILFGGVVVAFGSVLYVLPWIFGFGFGLTEGRFKAGRKRGLEESEE